MKHKIGLEKVKSKGEDIEALHGFAARQAIRA